jgi:hypothetical protein
VEIRAERRSSKVQIWWFVAFGITAKAAFRAFGDVAAADMHQPAAVARQEHHGPKIAYTGCGYLDDLGVLDAAAMRGAHIY